MHTVIMVDPKEQTQEKFQTIAKLLGITAFEVQQRMIGGAPAVLGTFPDLQQAQSPATKHSGFWVVGNHAEALNSANNSSSGKHTIVD